MRKIILTLFLIFAQIAILKAENVSTILIEGNKRVSTETIKIYGEIEKNKDYTEKDLNKILNNLYSTNFFEDVQIQINNGVLKVTLKEYPMINNLILLGEPNQK